MVSAIGAGGMGEGYRATDTELKRQVAIKILPSYIAADQRLTAVRVTLGANGKLGLGTPIPLFRTELDGSFLTRQQYVVSPDGQRFLLNASTDAIDPKSITLILNWKGAS